MRRRDFVRGLMALGVTAAVADQLAFVEGLGRTFATGNPPFRFTDDFTRADAALGPAWSPFRVGEHVAFVHSGTIVGGHARIDSLHPLTLTAL